MLRPSSFIPAPPRVRKADSTKGIADFLQSDDKLALLLPAVERLVALRKECAKLLGSLFDPCAIHQFDNGLLILSAPNAALATRLKQRLPTLQETLVARGWQVSVIRLKVQVSPALEKHIPVKQARISEGGIDAFAQLGNRLEKSKRNTDLLAALERLTSHRQRPQNK